MQEFRFHLTTRLFLCRSVKGYPVREILEHEMHATLEWVLPSPMPQHCFEQSPIVIEVKNRNPITDEH